jgi:SAM-dependent methyltransferase
MLQYFYMKYPAELPTETSSELPHIPTSPDSTPSLLQNSELEPEIVGGEDPKHKDAYWGEYYRASQERPPAPILVEALDFVTEKENACDLGAGTLRDANFLLENGFQHVTTVDSSGPYKELMNQNKDPRITMQNDDLDLFELPASSFDLVSGQRVFHYTEGSSLAGGFIHNISSILKPGGIFTTTMFSDKDILNSEGRSGFFPSKDQMEKLLDTDFEIIKLEQHQKNGVTAKGEPVINDVLEIIARKK